MLFMPFHEAIYKKSVLGQTPSFLICLYPRLKGEIIFFSVEIIPFIIDDKYDRDRGSQ